MKKRILATVLWFFAGWYLGNVIAYALEISPVLGPIIGTAAAALVGLDPRHMFWAPSAARERAQARLTATALPNFETDR